MEQTLKIHIEQTSLKFEQNHILSCNRMIIKKIPK
jgi:hypothetical protein